MAVSVEIFDTTLRDGEQSPGASMNEHEKYQMALQIERLGVDVIEAGFPIASKQEFEGVRHVAEAIKNCRVAALARALPKDIERAVEALKPARYPVLHTFLATSDIHMEYKLRMTRQQVLEAAEQAVRLAKKLTSRVEFSAEDATRSDWDFLVEVTKVVVAAGADVVNLPDTVGFTTPIEIRDMFRYVIERTPGAENIVFSSHNHNDLGLAVANALAAVEGGARQVECTVNGIGERAGNTSLEEFVMAMRTRHDTYPYDCRITSREIVPSSSLLSKLTGLQVPYNKPIVGRNAFAHESGIHQHGMIANAKTYEIMTPESVGRKRSDLVLGKHSGRAGLATRCAELGYELDETKLSKFYDRFIDLAERKKEVFDDDLQMLIVSMSDEDFRIYRLLEFETFGHNPAKAIVRLAKGEENTTDTAAGDGPVDAACRAIERIAGVAGQLDSFEIRASTPGKEAVGEAYVVVKFDGRPVKGRGASTDIVEASILAYLDAVNKHIAHLQMVENAPGK
jgi:2-isopropylmalate synthase